MELTAADFDYPLDPQRIAQQPAERRDLARLLTLDRATGRIGHRLVADLPDLLRAGDLLVVNDTRVVPGRFLCRRATGGRIEGLFLREPAPGRWEVLLKGAGRCKKGEHLLLERSEGVHLELGANRGEGAWTVAVRTADGAPPSAHDVLARAGRTPLPPYIRREADIPAEDDQADRRSYQTVYADRPGAVAAPTAGLHFTDELLARLADGGIERAAVTLHVGLGTFAPVKVNRLADHPMHSEWYDLPAATARAVQAAKDQGRRVVAVGTTSVRVLESAARAPLPLHPSSGWTDLFLYPPADFLVTDALLTNFHLPRSTLVMLVAAFCTPGRTEGRQRILDTYAEAAAKEYRFYSYGDAMLIE